MSLNRIYSALLVGVLVGQVQACGGKVSTAPWFDPAEQAGTAGDPGSAQGGATAGASPRATGGSGATGTLTGAPSLCGMSVWVTLGQVDNVRDLGGIPVGTEAHVTCSALYRGMHLHGLSAAGCDDFEGLGIRSVIDLRSVAEQTTYPDASCVTVSAVVTLSPMAIPYSVSPADYLKDLYELKSMRAALEVLSDPARYPVYIHCTYGRDRTGILAAVVLLALGASREAILTDYRLTAQAGLSITPDSLVAVLDEISRIGGIESYFEMVGVAPGTLGKLRAHLVASPREG